jgi:protein involved in polysaccharide export with SLBB domain
MLMAFVATGFSQNPVVAETQKGYTLGPGDVVTGKVLGEPQFDFEATIDADGRIEIPFVEKPLLAKCKTEGELRNEVTELLKKYLKSPQVSLRATQRNSRPPVSIYGEVKAQGKFDLTRRVYLLELIAYSGGETEKSGGMVQIFRPRPPVCAEPGQADWGPTAADGSNVPSKLYSLASLRQGREEANPEVLPGDIIVVGKAAPVYVTGEVAKPGEMNIPEGGLPLMQAIAMASGVSREAKTKEIKIYRRKPGSSQPEVIAANYDQIRKGQQKDLMLEPFDIVEVGKAGMSFGELLKGIITGLPNRIPIPIP